MFITKTALPIILEPKGSIRHTVLIILCQSAKNVTLNCIKTALLTDKDKKTVNKQRNKQSEIKN